MTARHREVLSSLVEMGAELAREAYRQGMVGELPIAEATIAFERIARCVRRSAMLVRRLAEPVAPFAHPAAHRMATRARVLRAVEDTINGSCEADAAESLHAELRERMDAPELEDEIGDRPTEEIIAEICADLGVTAIAATPAKAQVNWPTDPTHADHATVVGQRFREK